MVELVHAGRKPTQLAREFKCSEQSIHNWVAQARADARKPARNREVLSTPEREELARLRRADRRSWPTKTEARMALFTYIEGWYNRGGATAHWDSARPWNSRRSTTSNSRIQRGALNTGYPTGASHPWASRLRAV
jgi:hypothetical protein